MKEDAVYLEHILDCIRRIEAHTKSGRESFLASDLIQDAVLRNLQVLAESTQRLSDTLKAKHSEIEWARVAAFRNILVHDYLGVDLERVWGIVEKDVPVLKRAVERLRDEGRAT